MSSRSDRISVLAIMANLSRIDSSSWAVCDVVMVIFSFHVVVTGRLVGKEVSPGPRQVPDNRAGTPGPGEKPCGSPDGDDHP